MLRRTHTPLILSMLPKWLRTAKENEKDTLPPRDFALQETKREEALMWAYLKKEGLKQATRPDPTNIVMYSLFAFSMMVLPYALWSQRKKWKTLEQIVGLDINEEVLKSGDLDQFEKMKDPNRPPWPLLHFNIVEMREGKRGLDQLGEVWEQTRVYYPTDWLIPVEMVQILKYNSPLYLSQFVADPEQVRKEVYQQLLRIKHTKVTRKNSNDILEIVRAAADDCKALNFKNSDFVSLVPKNT